MTLPEQSSKHNTGLPLPGEPDFLDVPVFLAVGKLRRPHGVHGEMLMDVLTDFPERLQPGLQVYLGESHQPLRLHGCRNYAGALLVTFEEFTDPEAAGKLRNELLYVRTDEIPSLPAGEYYHHQILGISVVSDTGLPLGTIVEILETGANDVCVVRPESGPEILIPLVDAFVLQVDLDARLMRVHLLEGLV
jgi:16S rRNA processing protein RimM